MVDVVLLSSSLIGIFLILILYRDKIVKGYQILRMIFKLILHIPPDDGTSVYKALGSDYGSIKYRYMGEDRLLLLPLDEDARIYGASVSMFAESKGQNINITPPPGVKLTLTPMSIGVEKIVINSDKCQFTYINNEEVTFPPMIGVYE